MSNSKILIDLQNVSQSTQVPDSSKFKQWVSAALLQDFDNLEQTIRIVDEAESQQLNNQYRGKDYPTNVLSFNLEEEEYLDYSCLGDLVICAPVVNREAAEQAKDWLAHWAHIVVHGMLHLQGYDHQNTKEANHMERLEIEILAALGHTNPYQLTESP
jgi:probable rRNA maturation factor